MQLINRSTELSGNINDENAVQLKQKQLISAKIIDDISETQKHHKINVKKPNRKKQKRAFGQDITNQHSHNNNNNIHNNNGLPMRSLKKRRINVGPSSFQTNNASFTLTKKTKKQEIDDHKSTSNSPNNQKQLDEKQDINSNDDCNQIDEDDDLDHDDMDLIVDIDMPDWDKKDVENVAFVTDYVNDIMQTLRNTESSLPSDFMAFQNDAKSQMRTTLVDWLVEVHRKFKLLPSTFFLCVNLLDRYLAKKQIKRSKLQLLGCCCLWLASKYHEIYAPEMEDFVYISDEAFSCQELANMEIVVLSTLNFELTVPTSLSFAERFIRISRHYLKKEKDNKIVTDMIMFLIENCLMCYELCFHKPSIIAAAAFTYSCLSTRVITIKKFESDNLKKYIGYDISELCEIMKKIHIIITNKNNKKYKGLLKKYSSHDYSGIAKLNFEKLKPNQEFFL